jgi:hypothetical protein
VPSATELVSLLRTVLHPSNDGFALFRTGQLIDLGIELPLFLIAVGILVRHFAMYGSELSPDPGMLHPYHGGRPAFRHAGFLFPEMKKDILFSHNMAPQAEFEFFDRFLGLGKSSPLQLLKGPEQPIQPSWFCS